MLGLDVKTRQKGLSAKVLTEPQALRWGGKEEEYIKESQTWMLIHDTSLLWMEEVIK